MYSSQYNTRFGIAAKNSSPVAVKETNAMGVGYFKKQKLDDESK
jgi:hypothetical protein